MDTLDYIIKKYNITDMGEMPIDIPNVGRNNLPELFNELGFKEGAEIGVESGAYSQVLCEGNPGVHLYSIDPWKSHRGYRDHVNQKKLDGFYKTAKKVLAPYNCEVVRKFSMDSVNDFKDGSLDFVYIDANHDFVNVTNDIHAWSRKVKVGGILAGHDYVIRSKWQDMQHAKLVVDSYTRAYGIRPYFVLGTKAINPGEVRDNTRSWMWVI